MFVMKFTHVVRLLCWLSLLTVVSGADLRRPNIVFVLIDDLGWGDFSIFGNQAIQTPAIDRLAREGIHFKQFYVNAPICSPSRAAFLTGQYPQRLKITSFLNNRAENERRGMVNWLPPETFTLSAGLNAAGYRTGHFGKWHLGGQRDVSEAPEIKRYGFDASLTNFEGMGPKLLPLTLKPGDEKPGKIWEDAERLGGPVQWVPRATITGGFAQAALDFMKESSEAKKPFYVNLWPDDVHTPHWPPVARWKESVRERYLVVLEELDRQLGVFFEAIRNHPDWKENTLILLCSDNGHEPGSGSAGPLRGAKGGLYEGGIRSPLIVWGPGVLSPEAVGKRNDASVFAAMDVMRSLLEFGGGQLPAENKCEGELVLPILLGKQSGSRIKPIFWRRPPDRRHAKNVNRIPLPDLAVRDGDWKLLCNYQGAEPELYFLKDDPNETKNLAAIEPEKVKQLSKFLLDWHASMPPDQGPQLETEAKPSK
jgi:arylsulfatase A-like enzyme